MNLPGQLRSTTLGDLLGTLFRGRASGVLALEEPSGRTHRVTLRAGLVTAVEVDGSLPPLGDLVRREKLLDEEALNRSILASLRSQRMLGEVLVDEFQLAPTIVEALLRRQISQRLRFLESVVEARIRFHAAVRPPRSAFSTPLDPEAFLHGRKRARDEAYSSDETPHSVLGVSRTALPEEVRRAFRTLVRRLHPDLNGHLPEGERRELTTRFLKVKEAYRTLVNAEEG